MKKISALIIFICFISLAIFSCNGDNNNSSPNIPISSEPSKNVSEGNISASSEISYNDFSDIENSSKDEIDNSSIASSDESDINDESTSIPDESDINDESTSIPDESEYESSLPDESENISDTSSETSSEISSNPEDNTSSETTSKPAHTCSFIKVKTVEPTCTKIGYTIYKCSCGKTEKRDYFSSLGHIEGEWTIIEEATATSTGLKQLTCGDCGEIIDEEVIPATTDIYNFPATAENSHLVEERVLHYLNQYRIAEGTPEATFLWEGKTYKYAKARAEQLVTNFAHDMDDIRAVATELQFGHYVEPYPISYIDPDTGEIVYTGEMTEPYYSPGCSEAITGPYGGYRTVDDYAKKVAASIYNSKTHWSYVGAETTMHITVGCYVDVWGDFSQWYFCIATSSSDQYD